MGPSRVLFVLERFWPHVGGVEVLFDRLARSLVRRGHACTVLTARGPGQAAEETRQGVRIVRVGSAAGLGRYAFPLRALPRALSLAAACDVIHTTTYTAAPLAWLASRLRGVPVVLTVHEYLGAVWHALPDTPWPRAVALRVAEHGTVALPFDAYVAVSRATRNALRHAGTPDRRLSVVHNGIEPETWRVDADRSRALAAQWKADGAPLIGYYGRAGVTKGIEGLVTAVERLRRRRPMSLLLILGEHPPRRRRRLEAWARERLGDAVIVRSSVPREALPTFLDPCDCLAVPSLTEGFGFAAWEACATGKPVVASDVGSIPEVTFGRCQLVPPGDAEALAAALDRAVTRAVPYAPARTFPVEAMVDGYEAVYARLRGRAVAPRRVAS